MRIFDTLKGWYLKKETYGAIDDIAKTLKIPKEKYASDLPKVMHDSKAQRSFYSSLENKVTYCPHFNGIHIYEEAGHFLSLCLKKQNEPRKVTLENIFFKSILEEGVGYFCSTLRNKRKMHDLKEKYYRPTMIKINFGEFGEQNITVEPANKLLLCAGKGIIECTEFLMKKNISSFLNSEENLKKSYRTFISVIKKYRRGTDSDKEIFQKRKEIFYEIKESYSNAIFISENVYVGFSNAMDFLINKRDYFYELCHDFGYDLGAKISKLYCIDKNCAKEMILELMNAEYDDPLVKFMELHKSLKKIQ